MWASTVVFAELGGAGTATASPKDRVIVYEDSARMAYEKYSDSSMRGASTTPMRQLPSQTKDTLFGEELGHSVSNCSTAKFRCVSVWSRVFAVPLDRLSPTAAYSVAGALLKVEDCLRGDVNVCQVAIVSADCQRIAVESCESVTGGRESSSKPGPIVYFIYNEDHGVTAYGVSDKPAKTKDERLGIASQMILQGQTGLLAVDH
jgi:hypothetical protein